MVDDIRLSIIIPYYNANAWIGRMLDSLLDQDLPEEQYEILVIDDGSTEPAVTLQKYENDHSNIIVIHQENGGTSAARNYGMSRARGKWLYICDSDDFVQPQLLGHLLDMADDNDLDMLVCKWCVVDQDAKPQGYSLPIEMTEICSGWDYLASFTSYPMGVGFGVWRYLLKKESVLKNGIRFENFAYVEDRIFQLDLFQAVKRVARAEVMLYYYVQHKESIMHNKRKQNYDKYAQWIWLYIDKITALIQDGSLSDDAKTVLEGHRDFAVFSLLGNSIKYCPVSTTKEALERLKTINGAYPVQTTGVARWIRLARRYMNHPCLWLLSCRLFHILPFRVRQML